MCLLGNGEVLVFMGVFLWILVLYFVIFGVMSVDDVFCG